MVESERVTGKGRIRASTQKLFGRVSKNGRNSEYRKMVESGRVPGKGRIRASTQKLFERVLKNGRIRVSTEKW